MKFSVYHELQEFAFDTYVISGFNKIPLFLTVGRNTTSFRNDHANNAIVAL